jgi:hypothetical protein
VATGTGLGLLVIALRKLITNRKTSSAVTGETEEVEKERNQNAEANAAVKSASTAETLLPTEAVAEVSTSQNQDLWKNIPQHEGGPVDPTADQLRMAAVFPIRIYITLKKEGVMVGAMATLHENSKSILVTFGDEDPVEFDRRRQAAARWMQTQLDESRSLHMHNSVYRLTATEVGRTNETQSS